jgi:hypothetical protein
MREILQSPERISSTFVPDLAVNRAQLHNLVCIPQSDMLDNPGFDL